MTWSKRKGNRKRGKIVKIDNETITEMKRKTEEKTKADRGGRGEVLATEEF